MTDITGIDHIYITVNDLAKSEQFYDTVFGILGFNKNSFESGTEKHIQYFCRHFGYIIRPARSDTVHNPYSAGLHHLCLRVESIDDVFSVSKNFWKAGIAVTEPQLYPEYAPDYYAFTFTDPDGIRLEITNYRIERKERHDNWEKME
ncbi:MAG: VOC family protein [Fibrobacter sp.]|nr:VOC family protein [Fibrobacter sp.]